jgi:hypothetical protein
MLLKSGYENPDERARVKAVTGRQHYLRMSNYPLEKMANFISLEQKRKAGRCNKNLATTALHTLKTNGVTLGSDGDTVS